MAVIDDTTVPVPKLEVRVRNVRGVIRIAVPESAFDLSETAGFIWRRIDGRRTAAEIGRLLAAEYEVTAEEAVADTKEILASLAEEGAIALSPAGPQADGVG
ncbi:PqqD family protein [Kitasatospora sp. NPDC002227]|uniref:PqqD family protein n=1 Tax=Kitasatospora sp. NPDC002227 TaxID=3154773 RepID=UPI003317BD16